MNNNKKKQPLVRTIEYEIILSRIDKFRIIEIIIIIIYYTRFDRRSYSFQIRLKLEKSRPAEETIDCAITLLRFA